LEQVEDDQCTFYKLKIPVSIPEITVEADIVKECLNEYNLEEVDPVSSWKALAPVLYPRHVYMVIKLPQGAPQPYTLVVDLIICFR